MKKIYTFIAACLIASGAMAQVSGTTTSGLRYGIKAGVNFATIALSGDDIDDEDKDFIKSLTSFQVGAFADIPVSTTFSIQPGLTLSGKGYKTEVDVEGFESDIDFNIMYLEIPVNAVYKIGGVYLGAGPYAAFAISGKMKGEDNSEDFEDLLARGNNKFSARTQGLPGQAVAVGYDEKLEIGNGADDDVKGTDFGLNFTAGYLLNSGLSIGANYGLGLSNIIPDSEGDGKAKNRVFSITVGFSF